MKLTKEGVSTNTLDSSEMILLKSYSELIKTLSQGDNNWIIPQDVLRVLRVGATWQFILSTLKFCKALTQQFHL